MPEQLPVQFHPLNCDALLGKLTASSDLSSSLLQILDSDVHATSKQIVALSSHMTHVTVSMIGS